MTNPSKPRVLLIAESANPEWSSVPLEGWSHSRALAGVVDGHLVTQVRNRRAIVDAGLAEGREFTAIDSESVAYPAYRISEKLRGGKGKGWTTTQAINSLTYYYFEHLVWKQFGDQIKAREYDVVHRLIPLSPTSPSLLARRCHKAGVPFVLGPLNGGLPWPKGYNKVRFAEREWLSVVRSAYRLIPGYQSTRKHSAAIIIGSTATWAEMPAAYRDRCVYIPENAIDPERFPPGAPRRASTPIRLVFVGRLVPYKGADVAIEAAAPLLRDGTATLDIVGDGPQRGDLEQLVAREAVGPGVTFHGNVKHTEVSRIVGECDVFVFPSIREFGGTVVLEAMAMGTVPMVVNYGGPGELATPRTGFLIELADRTGLVQQFRDHLEAIASDHSLVDERRPVAISRARTAFTWHAKALQVLEVYRWVMGQRGEKPSFPMPYPDDPGGAGVPLDQSASPEPVVDHGRV